MAIKEKEVLIAYHPQIIKYYEDKGYDFPTRIDNKGRKAVKRGTQILVKIEDLTIKSNVKVTKICDICEVEVPNQQYDSVMRSRNTHEDKLDRCFDCSRKKSGETKSKATIDNCIATIDPEFAKLFWNKEDTFRFACQSNLKADFKCPSCGNKIKNKRIQSIFKNKLSCPCNDGIPYPEKFMHFVLKQLNKEFEFEKIFEWSDKKKNLSLDTTKRYDFYLNELNVIIETHGEQHYKESFKKLGARTLKEEQENDALKERLAFKNGIDNYIVIDCRKSKMEFIKASILKSKLNVWFDLSNIDWLKCHEYACNSIVKEVCDLWNEKYSINEIVEKIKLDRQTIRKYLKQGVIMNLCDYSITESKKRVYNNKNAKSIIQLTKKGQFLKEWRNYYEASENLNIYRSGISDVCKGKRKTAGGFKWIFKEDYVF